MSNIPTAIGRFIGLTGQSMQTLSPNGRVLVVDDEENVRLLLERSLARLEPGIKVQVANSSAQALEFLKGEPFDLVIADYQMPYMNGLELTRTIRQDYPNVKIVLMTAYPSRKIAEQVDELKVDGYLLKPFSTRYLRKIVFALLASPEFPCPLPGGHCHDRKPSENSHC